MKENESVMTVAESEWSETQFISEMGKLAAEQAAETKPLPQKNNKKTEMFSLKRYLLKKAKNRLEKVQLRHERREAKKNAK